MYQEPKSKCYTANELVNLMVKILDRFSIHTCDNCNSEIAWEQYYSLEDFRTFAEEEINK
jgi:hypothetical protein